MNYCVIVKISKSKISFWYQIEGSKQTPLAIKGVYEMPLSFYVSDSDFIIGTYARDRALSGDLNAFDNYFELIKDPSKVFYFINDQRPTKQLLYFGIEKYLSHFLREVIFSSEWSIESHRPTFPLRFWFEQDLAENERNLVISLFIEAGYVNIEEIAYTSYLLDVLMTENVINNKNSILLLTGIDNNLYIEFYSNKLKNLISRIRIEGVGSDPRCRLMAELMFEDISINYPHLFLNHDKEVSILLTEAKKVIQDNKPIAMGTTVLSNGMVCEYNVHHKAMEERLIYFTGDSKILSEIDSLLKINSIYSTNVDILLLGVDINTDYFIERLRKKFPNVNGVNPKVYNETINLILLEIAESGYLAKRIIPDAPPVLPGKNTFTSSLKEAKPILPPFNKKEPEKTIVKLPPPLPPKKKDEFISTPPLPSNSNLNMLIGKLGIVTSKLSFIGKVEIDNIEYEAITEKNELDIGTKVKVIAVSSKKYLQVEKIVLPPLPPKKKIILTNQLN